MKESINWSLKFLLILFSSSMIYWRVSDASWMRRVKFCENLAIFGIIYATDPLLGDVTKIFCLRWLIFDIFNYKLTVQAKLRAPIFQNQGSFLQILSLKRSRWNPSIFTFLTQVTYLTAVKNFKNSIYRKTFARMPLTQLFIFCCLFRLSKNSLHDERVKQTIQKTLSSFSHSGDGLHAFCFFGSGDKNVVKLVGFNMAADSSSSAWKTKKWRH